MRNRVGALVIKPGTCFCAGDITVGNIIFHTDSDLVNDGRRTLSQIPICEAALNPSKQVVEGQQEAL